MRVPWVLATVLGAVLLQVVLVRYAAGGRLVFDLVVVGVVYVALQRNARAGVVAGTVGGLLQDVLSGGVAGLGGLAKTIVGGAAGAVGSRFVVTRPYARALIVAGASVVHRLIMVGLSAMIDERWPGLPWVVMLEETALNTACGFVLFQATEAVPAALERSRVQRRARWGRRNW
jgi:rod shape-determining protein MreD